MLRTLGSIIATYAVTGGLLIIGTVVAAKLGAGGSAPDAPSPIAYLAVNVLYGTMVIVFGGYLAALVAVRKVWGLVLAIPAVPAFLALFAVAMDGLQMGPHLAWVYALTLLVPIARLTVPLLELLQRRA